MKTRVAINGFGRVGRQSLKAILERQHDLEVVAINDITDAETNAFLFKHDSNYGRYHGHVEARDGHLHIDHHKIQVLAERDPARLPWKDLQVEMVIESTGLFTDGTKAKAHLDAGAHKVLISAPAKNEDITIVLGVNEQQYDPARHHVISNASCTTNCLAPVAKVIHETFGIEHGVMTTIHAYTNDQRILDLPHKDLRRARAAALNIIPTSTGAAQAVALVLPELKGKFSGYALRVPTPTVSVVDFSVTLKKEATDKSLNEALKHAAEGPLKGILEFSNEPLVSMDYKGNPASSIVDGLCTTVVGGRLAKVVSWYDNEWGYSNRVADLVAFMARKALARVSAMDKASVKDLDVKGQRVLVRVDFNVPLKDGKVTDETRLRASLPTIRYLLEQDCKVILMSHLGRPDGQIVESMRMAPVAAALGRLSNRAIKTVRECVGPTAQAAVEALHGGDILLLENLRFHPEEEQNDPDFARQLAALGQVYVNDAFGTAHRAHASTAGVAEFLPACAGFLMAREIDYLGRVLSNPTRPLVALLGGAKVKDKIGVLRNLVEKVDSIVIGGGMAFTFLKLQGHAIGKSLLDEKLDAARDVLARAHKRGLPVYLPTDVVVAAAVQADAATQTVPVTAMPDDMMGLDIGPETVKAFAEPLHKAGTILWNGPMGVFEMAPFAEGTRQVANLVAASPALKIIGGGDSAAMVEKMGVASKMDHISTGGGAALEFLEGRTLPGVAALREKVARS